MYRQILLLADCVLLIGAAHLLYLASWSTWLVLVIAGLLLALGWHAIRHRLFRRKKPSSW